MTNDEKFTVQRIIVTAAEIAAKVAMEASVHAYAESVGMQEAEKKRFLLTAKLWFDYFNTDRPLYQQGGPGSANWHEVVEREDILSAEELEAAVKFGTYAKHAAWSTIDQIFEKFQKVFED